MALSSLAWRGVAIWTLSARPQYSSPSSLSAAATPSASSYVMNAMPLPSMNFRRSISPHCSKSSSNCSSSTLKEMFPTKTVSASSGLAWVMASAAGGSSSAGASAAAVSAGPSSAAAETPDATASAAAASAAAAGFGGSAGVSAPPDSGLSAGAGSAAAGASVLPTASRKISPKGSGPAGALWLSSFSSSVFVSPGFMSSPVASPKISLPTPRPFVIQAGLRSLSAPWSRSKGTLASLAAPAPTLEAAAGVGFDGTRTESAQESSSSSSSSSAAASVRAFFSGPEAGSSAATRFLVSGSSRLSTDAILRGGGSYSRRPG
mmetsp:Transcript_125503/g.366601  ORF Transcript_125503/g.366601 Transcript_125503/m.366601 type:complete len:319 (+) Transcript_125503:296-1252(+)